VIDSEKRQISARRERGETSRKSTGKRFCSHV